MSSARPGVGLLARLCLVAPCFGIFPADAVRAQETGFDWDLVSLEQNNIRFNGSVLSGFHSVRSAGVTPHGARKTGIGLLYTREELVADTVDGKETFDNDRLILNPKINYGFYDVFEVGAGLELNFANGKGLEDLPGGGSDLSNETELGFSAAVAGVKWNFLKEKRLRLAASFDTRAALQPSEFGMLEGTLLNFELDGDLLFTERFSMVANLQLLTSDRSAVNDQGILDLAAVYSFSDEFRGMVFTTVQEDDQANEPVFWLGMAGQHVMGVHSFTFAVDFQLNDTRRDIELDNQIDLEFSYTFTF